MSRYIGAIDQGTTSTRFIVFDKRGEVVSLAQKEHEQIFPRPGWVEHDAAAIWRNTQQVARDALEQADVGARELAGVGITNQRETTVLWDRRTGEPVCNALVWQDTRVDRLVAHYRSEGGVNRFRKATGLPLASYFSALKLKWMLDNVSGARALADAGDAFFGTMDCWLVWNLTGGASNGLHVTDVTNASRTQLMNLRSLEWDDELLDAFDIPRVLLPRIVASSENYGAATVPALEGVPIAGILGDQQAALVGQACFEPGQSKNTYGTGCFVLTNTGREPVVSGAGLITTVAYRFGDAPACYALEGSIAITGALVQWLRDNLGIIETSADIEGLASQVDDNGGVYFVPAFSGLYAPHWQESARGLIIGLTRYATRAHIARAALEATAYQTRDVIDAMKREAGLSVDELRVDGGMVRNALLMQFQADILNMPVLRPKVAETTALGAAYAAGLAVGFWAGTDELESNWTLAQRIDPSMSDERRDSLYGVWQKAVTRSFDWL